VTVARTAMDNQASLALMKFLSDLSKRLGVSRHVYVVGGAVRNFVIKKPIKDIDVVIDSVALKGKDSMWFAKEVARAIPTRTNIATNQYGVALLHIVGDWMLGEANLKGEDVEIANARTESYTDGGYTPDTVEKSTIEQDVGRREFTFNTLLWRLHDLAAGPDKAEIIDLTGCGLRDLEEGVMRCPSSPDKTFTDDPSRMIRAIKFLVKYGFTISTEVKRSIVKNKAKVKNIPPGHLSNMLINTFLREPTGKKALIEMEKLGLLDVIKEIAQKDKSFRDALGNWADREAKVEFIFDLMDMGLPSGRSLNFLDAYQLARVREVTVGLSSDAAHQYVAVLKQPGKSMDTRTLMQEFNLKGPQVRQVAEYARRHLLSDPVLSTDSRRLTQRVRDDLKGGKVAAWDDQLPGGLGDKRKPSDFPASKVEQGRKVEMEHTDDADKAREVALDHLTEDIDYYNKLETIEKRGKKFELNKGDPLLMGKYLNSPGRIEGFKDGPKGDPMVVVRKRPKKDEGGQGSKKEVKLFKVRYDKDQAAKDKAEKSAGLREEPVYGRSTAALPRGFDGPDPQEEIWGAVLDRVAKRFVAAQVRTAAKVKPGDYVEWPEGPGMLSLPTWQVISVRGGVATIGSAGLASTNRRTREVPVEALHRTTASYGDLLGHHYMTTAETLRHRMSAGESFDEAVRRTVRMRGTPKDVLAVIREMLTRPDRAKMRQAAKFQKKKEVPKAKGTGTTTVYEYSEGQIQHRNREKAKKVEKLRGSLHKLQAAVKKDLKSKDPATRLSALAVGLMNDTYERVGNDGSAKEGHVGVTGWKPEHVKFSGGKATFTYVGKSGVSQKKTTSDAGLVAGLREAVKNKGKGDTLFSYEGGRVDAGAVNAYLKPHGITAKDIRGLHANREVQTRLKAIRGKGGKLPSDDKERKAKLKKEFEQAVAEAAEEVGHEASTLRSQYLVPGIEDNFLRDGTVKENLAKQGAAQERWVPLRLPGGRASGIPVREKPDDLYLWLGGGKPKPPFRQKGNVSLEDEMHDWNWQSGKLRYHGVGSDLGRRSTAPPKPFWVVLHYKGTKPTRPCGRCGEDVPVGSNFCTECGQKQASQADMRRMAIIHINNATDGDEGGDLRADAGLISSLTLYEQAVVQDMEIHEAPLIKGRAGHKLRGHLVDPDAVTELVASGYLEEEGGKVVISDRFKAKQRLYRAAGLMARDASFRGSLRRFIEKADQAIAVFEWGQSEVSDDKHDPADDVGGGALGYVFRLNNQWFSQSVDSMKPERVRNERAGIAGLRSPWKAGPQKVLHRATKTKGQKEEAEVERLQRKNPTKKPPRKDLRRERMNVDDGDIEGTGADGDKDLSLNYKKIAASEPARRVAARYIRTLVARKPREQRKHYKPPTPKAKKPPKLKPLPKQEEPEHKPGGPPWKTDEGKWMAINPDGVSHPFGDGEGAEEKATAYAKGETPDEPAEDAAPEDEAPTDDAAPEDEAPTDEAAPEDESKDKEPEPPAAPKAPTTSPKEFQTEVGNLLRSSGLPTKDVVALKKLGIIKDPELFKAYTDELKAKRDELLEHGVSVEMMREGAKDPFKGLDTSDTMAVAAAIVQAKVNEAVLLNPSMIDGKPLSSEPLDSEARKDRAMASMKQFRRASSEQRIKAAELAVQQLAKLDPDSPQAAELNSIIDGIQAAAIMNEEDFNVQGADGKLLRKPLSPKGGMLLRHMVQQGNAGVLFMDDSTKVYQAEGRAAVRDAMGTMEDDMLIEMSQGTPWESLGKALMDGKGKLDPEVQEFLRSMMRDMAVNGMTTVQGVAAAITGTDADPTTQGDAIKAAREAADKVIAGEMEGAVDSFMADCMSSGEDVKACMVDGKETVIRSQIAGAGKAMDESGAEIDPQNVPAAVVRAINNGGDIKLLDDKTLRPEKPFAERVKAWVENVTDPDEKKRIMEMTPEEFAVLEKTVGGGTGAAA
jgi:tRNA nucleotidyltransferase/poly(A) polymerase/DNA topoisomerase IB